LEVEGGLEDCRDEPSSETVLIKLPWRPDVKERRGMRSSAERSEPPGEWSRTEFESVLERSGDVLSIALLLAI
jgi:hypothetical protein